MAESSRSLTYHQAMLSDRVRLEAYRRAIEARVRPGHVILDLGTGLGILAFFAARAGADRVYAIESSDIITLAQQVALLNGFTGITFLHGWSHEVELPERVDGIVTETLGSMALDENILEFMQDARVRFLKPGGFLIPERLRVWLAAVESEEAYERVAFWERPIDGIHFRPVVQRACKTPSVGRFKASQLLSEPALLFDIRLYEDPPAPLEAIAEMSVIRAGYLHGWVGWFEAELAPEITLNTAPGERETHWDQVFFPNVVSMFVPRGERLRLKVQGVRQKSSVWWAWELL